KANRALRDRTSRWTRSEKIVGEIRLVGAKSSQGALGGAAVGDFEVVHGKNALDQTRDFRSLLLVASREGPSEFGKDDRIDDARLVRRRGVDKASGAFALRRIILQEQ